jgi:hypothetical protein
MPPRHRAKDSATEPLFSVADDAPRPADVPTPRTLEDDARAALRAMDAKALRAFLTAELEAHAASERELASLKLLERAVRVTRSVAFLSEDEELGDAVASFCRRTKTSHEVDVALLASLLRRIRRQALAGRLAQVRAATDLLCDVLVSVGAWLEGDLARALLGARVLAIYETTSPEDRAHRMLEAVTELGEVMDVGRPLAALEAASVRPLDGLDAFLKRWEDVVLERSGSERELDLGVAREAAMRAEGPKGLERLARRTNDLYGHREWIATLVGDGREADALAAIDEAVAALEDPFGRAVLFEMAEALHLRAGRQIDALSSARAALLADPDVTRLARFLSLGGPSATEVERRASAVAGLPFTPDGVALLQALRGEADALVDVLLEEGASWEDEGHPGVLATLALVNGLIDKRSARGVATRVAAALRSANDDVAASLFPWGGFSPPRAMGFELPPFDLAPLVARALKPARTASSREWVRALRVAAATRVAQVVRARRRESFDQSAALVVLAAELSCAEQQLDVARAFLSEVIVATEPHAAFVHALRRWVVESPTVLELS